METRWASDCETRPAEVSEDSPPHRLSFVPAQQDPSCRGWTPDHHSCGFESGTPTWIQQSLHGRGRAQIPFGCTPGSIEGSLGRSPQAFEIPNRETFVPFRRSEL